jgi:hypothetical protein
MGLHYGTQALTASQQYMKGNVSISCKAYFLYTLNILPWSLVKPLCQY